MSAESEWTLIRQCRHGRHDAFEPLVLRYQGEALAVAEALLLDPDDAADAVQDAFVRAYRGLARLSEGSPFGPWFRSIRAALRRALHDQGMTEMVREGSG